MREAAARGLEVMFTIVFAPEYAEGLEAGLGPPGDLATRPRRVRVLRPGHRQSLGAAGLPQVRYYQAWNEPNLFSYLNPQWNGTAPVAPAHYREMLNAFYAAVKGVDPGNVVITAGNSPYGDEPLRPDAPAAVRSGALLPA